MAKEKELKTKFVKKGKKITETACPHCKQELVVQTDNGAEVFVCENCKFKVQKDKKEDNCCDGNCDCCEK